ncbi:MBL fold metallo-hydrolase [Simiduia sp. 21SJ11W-1]|uniref:MBL fold metallo-hydrolase n=1 Tax=Simiduia sp. 21SJ11W-1 TaxID=2909669 RepID=UPI00209D1ADE|nr:MBL fold metallo-hydrolase [Simiduia sp. 21SJ11W-1]UTA49114.1 MBL fold metallo-hydrolase [Simiduia sp. 21SJ11W-1]
MRFASLGSGSKGNGTLVEFDGETLLIDCGFSVKDTVARLARHGKTPEDLSAVLVTHEHGDHLRGVPALARKYNLPVYITPGTLKAKALGKMPDIRLIEGYRAFELGPFKVQPVAVPHDAREPAQFVISANQKTLGVLTDLGMITAHVQDSYQHCDALVLEANHDPVMLAYGAYPQSLKQRVGGPWGHLSNQQSAGFLEHFDVARLQQLVIAHISQQNNSLEAAEAALGPVSTGVGQILYACQDQGFDWLEIN